MFPTSKDLCFSEVPSSHLSRSLTRVRPLTATGLAVPLHKGRISQVLRSSKPHRYGVIPEPLARPQLWKGSLVSKYLPRPRVVFVLQGGVRLGHLNGTGLLIWQDSNCLYRQGTQRNVSGGLHSPGVVLHLRQRQVFL